MFVAIIFTSVFFYLYHIFIGRTLGVETYGVFGALFSLAFFLQFILFRSVPIMIAKFIAKYKGQGNLQIIPVFHSRISLYMLFAGIGAFIVFLLLSGVIANFLHIKSILLVSYVGVIFLFCLVLSVNLGALQGLQRFNHLALMNALPAGFRLSVGVILILLGLGIHGAVGGLVMGIIIPYIVSFFFLRDIVSWESIKSSFRSILGRKSSPDTKFINAEIKEAFRFSFYVFIAIICVAIPTNIDVVLVKHFFTASDSGLFTAVTIFGRMIFALPVAITIAMYPKVVEAHTKKIETKSLLNKSLIYTALPAGLLMILYYLVPKFFIGLLYGQEYLGASSLLQLYGIFMFFFSLVTVLIYYSLAKNRYWFVYLFVILSIVELGLIGLYHSSLTLIIQIFLILSVIAFITGFCINYYPEIKKYPKDVLP